MQCYGGHGYIRDNGVEQFVRDGRINQTYEGANGVQAMDLVGRKLAADGGRGVMGFFAELDAFISANEADEDLSAEVRRLLFVFEDIVKLDERAIQQVLREVDQKDLVVALRGSPEDVVEVMLSNMSERGATMLKEEMEIQQPRRRSDIDEAQGRVVAVVRKLDQEGTIVLAGEEDPLAIRPQVLAEALPHGRLQLLTGDHMSALADPRFTTSIVEFLA